MAIPLTAYKDISFSTLFNYEHVFMKGSATLAGTGSSIDITHNLGYVPFARVYTEWPIGEVALGTQTNNSPISTIWYADSTKLHIEVWWNGGPTLSNVPVHYRIYAESL